MIEAEAMELPVIVTNIPGPTDAMAKDETGLVIEKQDSQALQQAMQKLYEDKELRESLGRQGLAYVSERFDQDILFSKILQNRLELLKQMGELNNEYRK